MTPENDPGTAWSVSFAEETRARGLRRAGNSAYTVDAGYIAVLSTRKVPQGADRGDHIVWTIAVKPLALDDILWAALLPDLEADEAMNVDRRVDGELRIESLEIGRGRLDMEGVADLDWSDVLGSFDALRRSFIATHPTPAEFVRELEDDPELDPSGTGRLRLIVALLAADRTIEGVRIARASCDRRDVGPTSTRTGVYQRLMAYALGPEEFEKLLTTSSVTHDLQIVADRMRHVPSELSTARDHPRFSDHLSRLNGEDPWALVLTARPPFGEPSGSARSLYIQAAGTAERMTIELCRPGGGEFGAVAVRSVVGRAAGGPEQRTEEIAVTEWTSDVRASEVFSAREAAELFEAFFRTDTVGEGYTLRPVQGFRTGGESVRLDT